MEFLPGWPQPGIGRSGVRGIQYHATGVHAMQEDLDFTNDSAPTPVRPAKARSTLTPLGFWHGFKMGAGKTSPFVNPAMNCISMTFGRSARSSDGPTTRLGQATTWYTGWWARTRPTIRGDLPKRFFRYSGQQRTTPDNSGQLRTTSTDKIRHTHVGGF